MDHFRSADCLLAVLVEINEVDVRSLQQNLVVVLSQIVLKFGSQPDHREGSYGISKLAQSIAVQADRYQGKGFANRWWVLHVFPRAANSHPGPPEQSSTEG